MVVGEAPPDGLRHQRVDARIARPHEEGAVGSAEPVIRRIEDEAAEQGGQDAPQQQAAVPYARQDGHRPQPPGHQEQPVQRQGQQRRFGAQPHAPDQEQGEPSGDRPFVAELDEQEQREQNRARASEVLEGLPQGRLCPFGQGREGAPAVYRRKNRRHDRQEHQNSRHRVLTATSRVARRHPNPYQMPPRLTVAAAAPW